MLLLVRFTSVLNRDQEAEETDTSSKRDNRSPSPLDNWDAQTAILMAEKKVSDVTSEVYKPKATMGSKSMVVPQKGTQLNWLLKTERQSLSAD